MPYERGGLILEQPARGGIGQWLKARCQGEGLSLRQAAARTGLSHATIADIINGAQASPQTIKKLALAFGGDGHRGLALQDELLTLAGYRSQRVGELSEPVAELMDKLSEFSEPELKLIAHFADFLSQMQSGSAKIADRHKTG